MDKLFEEGAKYIDGNLAPIAYLRMAEGKLKLGDRQTAVQYCTKSVEKAGDDEPMVIYALEKSYSMIGEQETERLCKQKLDANPDDTTANWAMYNMYRLKGDYSKAIEYLDKCMKTTTPEKPQWLAGMTQKAEVLILAYTKTSDNKYLNDALSVYESLLVKMPNNSGILNNVAFILADNNRDLDKALEYAKRAHDMQPDDPGYLDTYAIVLYKKGKYADALQNEQAAIQQYESQQGKVPADAYENLGKIREQLGDTSQARTAYEQAMDAGGKDIQQAVKDRINAAIERLGKSKGDEKKGQ
jgi:tetratricopeptide (TPR) repeat protein